MKTINFVFINCLHFIIMVLISLLQKVIFYLFIYYIYKWSKVVICYIHNILLHIYYILMYIYILSVSCSSGFNLFSKLILHSVGLIIGHCCCAKTSNFYYYNITTNVGIFILEWRNRLSFYSLTTLNNYTFQSCKC